MAKLVMEVAEIRAKRIVIEGSRINLKETDNLCIHALPHFSIMW